MPRLINNRAKGFTNQLLVFFAATELLDDAALFASDGNSQPVQDIRGDQATADPFAARLFLLFHLVHVADMGIDVAIGLLHLADKGVEIVLDAEIIAATA